MTAETKKLVYFEKWIDPVAEEILAGKNGIDLHRLSFGDAEEGN